MKLNFKGFSIRTEIFDNIEYLRDFDLIAFTYCPDWEISVSQDVVLNLCFNNAEDVRKVYMKYLEGLKSDADEVNLTEFMCTWPIVIAKKVEAMEALYLNNI